jgi:hypothetical protein
MVHMIDNFLNDLKVKRFISVSKDTDFDLIYKLKDEGLIENKSKFEYRLTKEGIKAADIGYDKYIQSLDLESNQSFKYSADKTTNSLNPKSQKKLIKGLKWSWKLISENPLISIIIVAIIFYLIKTTFGIELN